MSFKHNDQNRTNSNGSDPEFVEFIDFNAVIKNIKKN